MLHFKILFNHREHGVKSASGLYVWLWSWLFICTLMLVVHAQEIDMSGKIDFNRNGDSVTLSAETIRNYRAQGSTSGNLILQLWATKAPYYGQARLSESPLNGFKMGEASLGTLSGNNSRSNVNESVVFTGPSAGYYNVVLVLGELNGSDYRILDWFNFTQIEAFGGLSPFTPPAASAPKTLIDEYIGTWEEVQSVTINGTTSETAVTTLIERLQDRGFISKAYIRKPGSPLIETQTSHYENGSLYGTSASNGTVIEDFAGEWSVGNRTITSNSFSSYTQTTSTTLAEGGQVTDSSLSTSEGSAGDGNAEKIMTLAAAPSSTPPPTTPVTPTPAIPTAPQAPSPKNGNASKKPAASKNKSQAKSSVKKTSIGSSKKPTAKKSKQK
jgi:hypothetical protein